MTKLVRGDDNLFFIAAALFIAQRRDILRLEKGAFDQPLCYLNDMCMRIDEEYALCNGEICFLKYGEHSHVVASLHAASVCVVNFRIQVGLFGSLNTDSRRATLRYSGR